MRKDNYQSLNLPPGTSLPQRLSLMWDWDSAFCAASPDLEEYITNIDNSVNVTTASETVNIPHCPHHYVDAQISGGNFDLIAARIDQIGSSARIECIDDGMNEISFQSPSHTLDDAYLLFFRREVAAHNLNTGHLTIYCRTKSSKADCSAAIEFWCELHVGADRYRFSERNVESLQASDSYFWTRRQIAIQSDLCGRAAESGARAFVFFRLIDLSDRSRIGSIGIV